ncbi:MAG: tetratricopeptide repeat protein [Methanotrichaceae archaeon]
MIEDKFDKGVLLMHMEKFEEAIDFFTKFVEIDASDGAAWQKLAIAYVGSGNLEEGLSCAEKALEQNPQNTEILTLLGGICSLTELNDEALSYFDRSIEVNPDLTRSWISKIATLRSLGRIEEAKDCYRQGIEAVPNLRDPEDWNDLARSSYEKEEFQETIDILDFMLELEPNDLSYKFNKLGPLSKLKRYEDVVDLAGEIVEEKPDLVPGWMIKGIALLGLERYEEAVECFDQVIKMDPLNAEALNMKQKTVTSFCR